VPNVRTDDGFEFEMTREDRTIRCVCRRDGRESSVTIECGWAIGSESVQTEQVELIARGAWLAGQRLGRLRRTRERDR